MLDKFYVQLERSYVFWQGVKIKKIDEECLLKLCKENFAVGKFDKVQPVGNLCIVDSA